MGKLQRFDIIYDNPSAVFYAGQIITGRVIIVLSEPMEMKGIELEYKGSAEVNWTDTQSTTTTDGRDDTETIYYSSSEIYFAHSHTLLGNGNKQTIPAGEHCFPFTYTLPITIPSTFEGHYGYVRYYCRAIINRPWKFNSVCKMPFTVVPVLDLNQQPTARDSVTGQKYKHFCCLCCTTGPLSLMARIDRTGYVPGESIIINAEIDNLSNRKINYSEAILKTKITYHASGSTKTEFKDILELKRGPIEPGHSDVWSGEIMPIPPLPPSNLNGCEIIDIEYYIEVDVVPSGPAFSLQITLPILIGTIPLKIYFASFLPPPTVPNFEANFSPSAPPLPHYEDAPPPSYAECVFGQVNIRDHEDDDYTYGKLNYAPLYTYYNLTTAAPNAV